MKLENYPKNGKFGMFGGQFIPETLMTAVKKLDEAYEKLKSDSEFESQLQNYLSEYAGRPTPFYFAENLKK